MPICAFRWRTRCEHRRFPVGQCPGGEGHQGPDIRPSFCKTFNEGADRCLAYQHDAVAAEDGMILRWHKKEALLLFVNTPGAHLRLRYLHMHPRKLDDAGMRTGRRVERGEALGQIGNYDQRDHGHDLSFALRHAGADRDPAKAGDGLAPASAARPKLVAPAPPMARPRIGSAPLPIARPRHGHRVARG
jgi:hypothetical protein